MKRIRLLIINNNIESRRSITALFNAKSRLEVLDDLDDIESVVDVDYIRELQPDVVFYCLSSKDVNCGSSIRFLKQICPFTLVIVFSETSDQALFRKAFDAGADGFLVAPIQPLDLVTAIELTCRSGISFFPRSARGALLNSAVAKQDTGDKDKHV